MTSTTITIEIDKIKVDPMYYSFEYKVYLKDKLIKEGEYSSDHVWGRSKKEIKDFKKLLKKSEAVNIVLGLIDL